MNQKVILQEGVKLDVMETQHSFKNRLGVQIAEHGDFVLISQAAGSPVLVIPKENIESFFATEVDDSPEAAEKAKTVKVAVDVARNSHGSILAALQSVDDAIVDAWEHFAKKEAVRLNEVANIVGDLVIGSQQHIEAIEEAVKASNSSEVVLDIRASASLAHKAIVVGSKCMKALSEALTEYIPPTTADTAPPDGPEADKGSKDDKKGGKKGLFGLRGNNNKK